MCFARNLFVAVLIAACLVGPAVAASLNAPGGAVPAYFAKEIIASADAPRTLTTSVAGTQLAWTIHYNFSAGEVRYMRAECSDTMTFDPATTVVLSDPAAGNVGAINGLGSNVLTFSITSTGGPANNIVELDTLSVVGNHVITGTYADVSCEVALYDSPSAAQAGGTAGRINSTRFVGVYLKFVPSYEFVVFPSVHTSNINAVPSFSAFEFDPPTTTLSRANLGASTIAFQVRDPDGAGGQTAPFGVTGAEVVLSDLLAATTTVTVTGDFTIAANTVAPFYTGAALGRVRLNGLNSTALTASTAVFTVGNVPFAAGSMALTRNAGAIPTATYFATVQGQSVDPATYAVLNPPEIRLGAIVRNSTELQAPFVDVRPAWISRLVLTNSGNIDRRYVITVQGETGNTISSANLTGTIKANKSVVINDLKSVLTGFTKAPRATLNITVAGPTTAIQGLYQVVDPQAGTISNHVLVRPGTN